MGGSLSGSGPSVFAWAPWSRAEAVAQAFQESFLAVAVPSEVWISPPDAPGAHIVEES
jgi:homoserine kinase